MKSRSVLAAVLCALFLGGAPALAQSVDLRLNTRVAAPGDPVVATASYLFTGCDFVDVLGTRVEGNRVLVDAVIVPIVVTCIPIPAQVNHESIVLPSLPVGNYTVELAVEGTRGDSVPLQIRERTELLLRDLRFKVEVTWDDPRAGTGQGKAVPLTEESGGFWFFDDENLEVTVKILDGRAVNDHFWVFLASMTDVGFTLKVTWLDHPCLDDLVDPLPDPNCAVRTYRQSSGQNRNVLDVEAFELQRN
jgi:hypothetical protein